MIDTKMTTADNEQIFQNWIEKYPILEHYWLLQFPYATTEKYGIESGYEHD